MANYAKASIKSNATVTDSEEFDCVLDTWLDKSKEWAVNPADDEDWEWADIDALQIGVSIKGTGFPATFAQCTQVYVEVDYTPAAVGTNMQINISDIWKDIESLKINISDVWKDVIKIQQNIGNVWKTVFE